VEAREAPASKYRMLTVAKKETRTIKSKGKGKTEELVKSTGKGKGKEKTVAVGKAKGKAKGKGKVKTVAKGGGKQKGKAKAKAKGKLKARLIQVGSVAIEEAPGEGKSKGKGKGKDKDKDIYAEKHQLCLDECSFNLEQCCMQCIMVYTEPFLKQKCYTDCQDLAKQQVLGHLALRDADIEIPEMDFSAAPGAPSAPAAAPDGSAPGAPSPAADLVLSAPGASEFPDIAGVYLRPAYGPVAAPPAPGAAQFPNAPGMLDETFLKDMEDAYLKDQIS